MVEGEKETKCRHAYPPCLNDQIPAWTSSHLPKFLLKKKEHKSLLTSQTSAVFKLPCPFFKSSQPHRQAHVLPSRVQLATLNPRLDKPETRHSTSSSALLERLRTHIQALAYPLHDLIVPSCPCVLRLHMFACCAGRATCRAYPWRSRPLRRSMHVVAFDVGGVLAVKGVGRVELDYTRRNERSELRLF